jgi:isopenicillin N synthase-like dioxygenase
VIVDYTDLADPSSQLQTRIIKAFGTKESLGVILIRGIPDYIAKRERLLILASRFAELDDTVKAKYEHLPSSYLFGWSHGKESMNGSLDLAKGSYYNNPTMDDPQQPEEYVMKYPEYGFPNVWPEELPEFKDAFKSLGKLISETGQKLAHHCDRHLSKIISDYPQNFLENAILDSKTCKARLLHYFPSKEINESKVDSWCGLHVDHSLLTGLTSAMFMDEESGAGRPMKSDDARFLEHSLKCAGLYIKDREGKMVKVEIPADCLAFQLGEAAQVASRGNLLATPHLVRSANLPNVSRNTFAVFLQPNVDHYLVNDVSFDDFTKEVMGRHY